MTPDSLFVLDLMPSPNHGERRDGRAPDMIVLHYTGMPDAASALSWLCDHLGIERSSSVAFGDSHNDLEMIGTAGIGIAMGNAEEAVKAAAAMVAPTNDEAGVAQVLADLMQVGV